MPDSTPITSHTFDLTQARREYSPKAKPPEVKRNFDYDMKRFLKHSSTHVINLDPVATASYLTAACHGLEKGLAMEKTKPGFGVSKIYPIIAAIIELEQAGYTGVATRGARACLQAYVRYHATQELPLPAEVEQILRDFIATPEEHTCPGGVRALTRKQITKATDFDYDCFIQTRSSLRHYTGEPVPQKTVENAVRQALESPRSCNREMRRVYAVYEPALRDKLLSFQTGNRGFGDKLGAVLIVTVDLRELDMVGERNQGWIDGGLFAMSLVYALHANRLGSCMLNWSVDYEQDQRLRETFDIPDHEVIITFIGVGQIPEAFEVAASPSPSVENVLSLLTIRTS